MRKILFTLVLLGLGVYFFPTILSTNWGKERLEHYLESHLGGDVSIETLNLSWRDHQVCTGVTWKQPEGDLNCYVEKIICEAPLFDCLAYKSNSLDLFLKGGRITSPTKIHLLRNEKNLDIRFTPVRAKVTNGQIAFEKTEIHLNKKFQLHMEGTLNLATNYLNVQLGIPSTSIKKMFKIKELPEGYVLEVPLSCHLSAKEVEKKLVWIFLKNYATVTSLQR